MRGSARARPGRPPKADSREPAVVWRDRLALLLAAVIAACLGWTFYLADDLHFLAPGPLTSSHGAITECSTCHTDTGGRLGWLRRFDGKDPFADSSACLGCHQIPNTPFNAHSASSEVLDQSRQRLIKVAAGVRAPQSARVQDATFPTHDLVARGVACATCHREHQGTKSSLTRIASEQCNACHVVKFDSFDGHHPEFENYPFKRRSRIIYDHLSHASKHYPDAERRDPSRRIPEACSSCHDGGTGRLVMGTASFERACSSCHLGQVTGTDRVSGSKGIAFLTLPGLDLDTLRQRNARVGEWPDASEAELTPFMKIMISRHARGRALLQAVDRLDLRDLSRASDVQIRAVAELVWEIKRLFYALISAKASDVLGDLSINCGARLSPSLVTDLTASMPRDVVVGAQRQWLPNLGAEMANRPDTSSQDLACESTPAGPSVAPPQSAPPEQVTAQSSAPPPRTAAVPPAAVPPSAAPPPAPPPAVAPPVAAPPVAPPAAAPPAAAPPPAARPDAEPPRPAPQQASRGGVAADAARAPPPARSGDQSDDLLNLTEDERRELEKSKGALQKIYSVRIGHDHSPPLAGTAGLRDETANLGGDRILVAGDARLRITPSDTNADRVKVAQLGGAAGRAADQTDDLLFPTEEELNTLPGAVQDALRAIQRQPAVPARRAEPPPAPPAAPPAPASAAVAPPAAPPPPAPAVSAPAIPPAAAPSAALAPRAGAAAVINIESDVDPESWAAYGGWYRQDYAIYYRPTGHKDKFIYSWLVLTGLQAPRGAATPAAAVFDFLTDKSTPGACVKCHSVDDIGDQARTVNFAPRTGNSRAPGRFTSFVHEPHFGILENRGCLTCHSFAKDPAYLQSYSHGDPSKFSSTFTLVSKDLCQSCHTGGMARQDCLLCHKYHVNGVTTPIMSTKLPGR